MESSGDAAAFVDGRFVRRLRDAFVARGVPLVPEAVAASLRAKAAAVTGDDAVRVALRWYDEAWPSGRRGVDAARLDDVLNDRRARQHEHFAAIRSAGFRTVLPRVSIVASQLRGHARRVVGERLQTLGHDPLDELELIDASLEAEEAFEPRVEGRGVDVALALDLHVHATRRPDRALLLLSDDPGLVAAVRLCRPLVHLVVPEPLSAGRRGPGGVAVPWALRDAAQRREAVLSLDCLARWFG